MFLKDKNLSIKAKGFLAVVMGLPSDWEFSINGICSIIKEGKTAIYNAIDELKENGYCVVVSSRDEKGRITGNDYTFFEEPHFEEPYTEKLNADNQPQLNTNSIKDLFDEEKEDNKLSSEKKELTWREDFNLFHAEVEKAKTILIADRDFKAKQEVYYPNLDYELSLQKMVEDYWGTETAWNKRKKQKKNGEGIDMVATLKKAFNQSCNRVYKRKTFSQPQLFNSYSYKKVGERASDYLSTLKVDVDFEMNGIKYLKDGTYINDGKRYYKTKFGLLKEIPIGLVARPSEDWEYDNNSMVWVQDERTETIEDMLF